ncbi:DUF2971 domain-containing protein [Streptococcus sp.]|uniref:DUF2971 domain-containing protein n=1 Tax=Streptococcus sp. TaxID=1306 RepID=UPI0025AEE80C|nr:DUF2971 domain-containing protein [Streptococcus sp.]MDN3291103.1 hypothetical protein [Streptococcus sp.]
MDEQKYNLDQSLTELDKLFDLSAKDTDKTACEALAEKARIIYEQYPESEDIAVRYAKTLFYLSTKHIVLKELETTAKKLEKLQQKFPESNDIAEALAGTLLLLSFEQTVLRKLETTAEKLEKLQQKFPKSNDIALHYARFLFILSDKQTVLKELEATVEKLQGLQQKFPESHDIAEAFAKTLLLLSIKQTVLKELETTAEKLEKLQQKFPESHDIAGAFARTLLLLSFEQTVLNELETTAEKLQELQQKFLESPVIALQYARFLFVLLIKQTELKKIEDTVEKLEKLQQQFQKSEEIAFIYGMFLASLSDHQTELGERLQTKETIKKLYEQFSKFMLQNFDDLFFRDDNVCYREEYKLFNFILKEGLLKNTKYAILQTWTERYKENSSELKNLLSIYQLVQKIKYQLGLKDEDKNQMLKFGHYTKGSTLQIMLNQEENDKKDFSVSGKTRLYNANYMNDPEEGIVIEQILGLNRRDVLEPSSWFLMSFTNKTDDLAMWSQYGDDAKGVCLVLREDDFSRFTSFNDVSWRQEKNFLEFSDKMYLLKSELNSGFEKSIFRSESENSVDTVNDEGTEPNSVEKDSDSKRNSDYLYRIAYVRHTEENLKLERTELFEKSEIEELEKLLNSLKEKLDIGSKITEKNYQDAISECIEEIRYLFKSVDYKYENELRILRYANLDPSNKEIKIDKTSGVGKLYIERKNSIQIGEVIFGPKFPNPEYVTPLLKLLDENIDYKKSTIKFR